MKKILLLLLLFVSCCGYRVFATDKTVFTVKGVEASAGSEVTVFVNMSNNPSYEMISMKLPVDTSKLDYLDCSINGFSKAMLQECSLNPNNDLIFYALTMYTEEDKLLTDTGNILSIRFKIKDGVEEDIPLNLSVTDYGKSETEPLEYDVVNGAIKINKNVVTKPVDSSENLSDEVKKISDESDDKVVWKSTDKEVATVDKEGNVEYRNSGNTTITAKDSSGRILYEKTYLVDKEAPKKYNGFAIIGVSLCAILVIAILFIILRRKRVSRKAI